MSTETVLGTTPTIEPTPAQPNPANVGAEEKSGIEYDHMSLFCSEPSCGGTHCLVYFAGGEIYDLYNFDQIELVSKLMDDESAQRFRNNIAQFQAEGKLQYLLPEGQARAKNESSPPRQKDRDLVARLREIKNQLLVLDDERICLEGKSISDFVLAHSMINHLVVGLNDHPELNSIFSASSDRRMKIRISVEFSPDEGYCDEERIIASQVIDPNHLISRDVSQEKAELNAREAKLGNESEKLMREVAELVGRSGF